MQEMIVVYGYSASINGLQRSDFNEILNNDFIEISEARYQQLISETVSGKVLMPDLDGMPVAVEPAPSMLHEWNGHEWAISQDKMVALDQLKIAEKITEINMWRDQQEQAGFVFGHAEHTWDGGVTVATRLENAVKIPALPVGFYWTDADNVDLPMTLEQLTQLNAAHDQAIFNQGFRIHDRQRTMKAEVEKLSGEALAGYVVGWPK